MFDKFIHSLLIIKDYIKYTFIRYKSDIEESVYPFKAMTLNLRKDTYKDGDKSWKYRKESVINLIKTEKPSVLGMQEVMPHMFKFILSKFYGRYDGYGINSFSNINLKISLTTYQLGNAIIWDKTKYKCIDKGVFWLSDTPNKVSCTFGNTEPRTCIYVGLKDVITNEVLYVYNTHLDHLEGNRKKMADLISTYIKDKIDNYDVILMGDLNVDLNIPKEKEEMASINELLDCSYNYTNDMTFNSFKEKLTKTLDAIYFNIKDIKCEVINVKLSDHLPIKIFK